MRDPAFVDLLYKEDDLFLKRNLCDLASELVGSAFHLCLLRVSETRVNNFRNSAVPVVSHSGSGMVYTKPAGNKRS